MPTGSRICAGSAVDVEDDVGARAGGVGDAVEPDVDALVGRQCRRTREDSAAQVGVVAHEHQRAREPLASLFYNRRHHIAKQQHAVERTRELFAKSLGYAKPQTQGDYAIARHFLQHEASAAAPYLVFLHATTRDDKHWPETRWQELLDLLADSGVHIKLPWGAPHEEARAKRLAEGREYVEVLPRMSLEQVAQVLAGARAVVSVDTGLSHLTAALDKPNFTLYGPTDPGLIGGYGKNQHIVRPENSTSTSDIPASRVHLLLQNQGLL